MKRINILLSTLATAVIATTLSACDFFSSPVDGIELPKYAPYLTAIAFLEANADTTFIFIAQSGEEGFYNPNDTTHYTKFYHLGCVLGADVTLTDLSTGQSAKAFNDYSPTNSSCIGLYMVMGNELPIISGHEYELRAVYKNVPPVSARCIIPTFSAATFDYTIKPEEIIASIDNIDRNDRYYHVQLKHEFNVHTSQLVTSEKTTNGSILLSYGNANIPGIIGESPEKPWLFVDTCIVYEIDNAAYRYFQKIELYNNDDLNPFSKPIYLFSNIVGGEGIFAARKAIQRKKK